MVHSTVPQPTRPALQCLQGRWEVSSASTKRLRADKCFLELRVVCIQRKEAVRLRTVSCVKRQPHGASWGQTDGWKVTGHRRQGSRDRDPGRVPARAAGAKVTAQGCGRGARGRAGSWRRGPPSEARAHLDLGALTCGVCSQAASGLGLTEAGRRGSWGGSQGVAPGGWVPQVFPEPGATPRHPLGCGTGFLPVENRWAQAQRRSRVGRTGRP